jgi:hypothetical protein
MNDQTHDFAQPEALTIARDVLARGYKPLPIPIGAKNPILSNWQNLSITVASDSARGHRSRGRPSNRCSQDPRDPLLARRGLGSSSEHTSKDHKTGWRVIIRFHGDDGA